MVLDAVRVIRARDRVWKQGPTAGQNFGEHGLRELRRCERRTSAAMVQQGSPASWLGRDGRRLVLRF
ncbi:hypothetical protein M0R45_015796 [Rubus argutus]|uniref:Uncharacterized protein n=1 Tax=Rubus argutus TaxID=59490 RepID=A0AAW1XQR4_RUBAR